MLPSFDEEVLRSWLIAELRPISDADPDVLARYDTDGNGRVSLSEFRPLVKELRAFQQRQQ